MKGKRCSRHPTWSKRVPNEVRERTEYKHKAIGTTEDFVAQDKREKEFSSPAAPLRITFHANTMLKTEKYTRILAIIINKTPKT